MKYSTKRYSTAIVKQQKQSTSRSHGQTVKITELGKKLNK